MTQYKVYRYLGRNGIIDSRVLLDGINHILFIELRADPGKLLTDGTRTARSVTVDPEEVSMWQEITDKTKQ